MSNLLNDTEGQNALTVVQRFQLKRRMSRFFKRMNAIAVDNWVNGNGYLKQDVLGDLNEYWDDEIRNLYRLLGLVGGLETSIIDTEIYIDPVNGSDGDGDGTATRPYKSLWFLQNLPRRINHEYSIYFVNDFSTSSDLVIDSEFGPDGVLSFVGVGAAEVLTGPFTVNTVGNTDNNSGQYIDIGGENFGPNNAGNFVQAIDGADAGRAAIIQYHFGANEIVMPGQIFVGLANPDTIQIIRPSRTFSFSDLTLSGRNNSAYKTGGLTPRERAKISFVNLRMVSSSSSTDNVLIENDANVEMSFCQLETQSEGSMRISGTLNNQWGPNDTQINSASGVGNIHGYTVSNIAGLAVKNSATNYAVNISGGSVRYVSERSNLGINAEKSCYLSKCGCSYLTLNDSQTRILELLCLGFPNGGIGAGITAISSKVYITRVDVIEGDCVLNLTGNSTLSIEEVGWDSTVSAPSGAGPSILFQGVGQIELRDSGVTLALIYPPSAPSADIQFDTVSPSTTPNIPIAYAWVTDSQGSFVKRLAV
jgi:hypothetical protein